MNASAEPNLRQALEERFLRLMPMVENLARWMVADDEDARSVGLAKLWETLRMRADCQDGYYLIAARNAIIDHLRKENLCQRLQPLDEKSVREDKMSAEVRFWLYDQLEVLPDRLRLPLVMHFLDGLSIKELAKRFGLSQRTIQRAIREAKIILRNADPDVAFG